MSLVIFKIIGRDDCLLNRVGLANQVHSVGTTNNISWYENHFILYGDSWLGLSCVCSDNW